MSFQKSIAALTLALGVVFGSSATAQEFQIAVDSGFEEEMMQFSGGIAPPYVYVWDIRVVQGQLAICGSGHLRDTRLAQTIRTILRDSEVSLNGRTYPLDLTFFTRARSRNAIYSQPATCRAVGPYNGGEVSFRMGSGTWRN